jgi:hypothetical protein
MQTTPPLVLFSSRGISSASNFRPPLPGSDVKNVFYFERVFLGTPLIHNYSYFGCFLLGLRMGEVTGMIEKV